MSKQMNGLDDFLAKANNVLARTERDLQALATEATLHIEEIITSEEAEHEAALDASLGRLRQFSQQLEGLVQHNLAVKGCLSPESDVPAIDGLGWSRIRILQSQEEERTRLARRLEDSIGQLLANAVFELASVRQLTGTDDAGLEEGIGEGLTALQTELEEGLAKVRHLIGELEPAAIMGDFGLLAGLRRYLERFERRTGLTTQLQVKTNLDRLPSTIEVSIFRVIQEALHNIEAHAQATSVRVVAEEHNDNLVFTIADDGIGFNPNKFNTRGRSFGLAGMQDYAELLNGRLRIRGAEKGGTQIILSIPYPSF